AFISPLICATELITFAGILHSLAIILGLEIPLALILGHSGKINLAYAYSYSIVVLAGYFIFSACGFALNGFTLNEGFSFALSDLIWFVAVVGVTVGAAFAAVLGIKLYLKLKEMGLLDSPAPASEEEAESGSRLTIGKVIFWIFAIAFIGLMFYLGFSSLFESAGLPAAIMMAPFFMLPGKGKDWLDFDSEDTVELLKMAYRLESKAAELSELARMIKEAVNKKSLGEKSFLHDEVRAASDAKRYEALAKELYDKAAALRKKISDIPRDAASDGTSRQDVNIMVNRVQLLHNRPINTWKDIDLEEDAQMREALRLYPGLEDSLKMLRAKGVRFVRAPSGLIDRVVNYSFESVIYIIIPRFAPASQIYHEVIAVSNPGMSHQDVLCIEASSQGSAGKSLTVKSALIKASTVLLSLAMIGSAIWLGLIAKWWEFDSAYFIISLVSYIRLFLLLGLVVRFFSAFVLYKPYAAKEYYPSVSVIIPAYNEGEGVGLTIEKALGTGYPSDRIEVIAINDGSKDDTLDVIRRTATRYPGQVKVISFEQNRGKLHGMVCGIKEAIGEVVIFVDSDSYIDQGSIYQLVQPLTDERIAAVSGRVRAHNTGDNILASMQDVRYYIMFKEKAADSVFGTVGCAPGCFSAYRREIVLGVLDEFAGVKVTCGEDRTLTNLVLRLGKRVVYQSTATASTIVPEKPKQFIRQQIRWQRSWAYEGLFAGRFMWKKNPIASFLFYSSFVQPYLMPPLIIFAAFWEHFIIGNNIWVVVYGLCLLPAVLSLYYLHKEERPHFLHYMLFTYFEVLVLYPAAYYCFATRTRNVWGTREKGIANQGRPSVFFRVKKALVASWDKIAKKFSRFSFSGIFSKIWSKIIRIALITLILYPLLFSAWSTFSPHINRAFVYAQEASAYYSWHDEPYDTLGSSQGWDLPSGWGIDERGYGVYPETQASLRIAGPGIASCDPVDIGPQEEFVLQFMLDIIELDKGSINIYIDEYARDGEGLRLLGHNLYADFQAPDIAYIVEEYNPSNPEVDAASISIEVQGEGDIEAYIDGVRLSRVDTDSQAYDFLTSPHVVFRFDDGWDSQIQAARVLDEHGFNGVFNIIPGLLEDSDPRLSVGFYSPEYMSLNDVRALELGGNQIGGHTINLQENTSALTDADMFLQIVGSADFLRLYGIDVTTYAAPEFYYDYRDQRIVFRHFPSFQIGPS
ncbi:MAG: glycosyltransferase, partial [Candidatus Omnitrophica bacterium]|nr:glycosyltransferase [Candidatus Omnitrophota bacterium]